MLDEDLTIVRDLASEIFGGRAEVERVRHVELHEGGHDSALWSSLTESGTRRRRAARSGWRRRSGHARTGHPRRTAGPPGRPGPSDRRGGRRCVPVGGLGRPGFNARRGSPHSWTAPTSWPAHGRRMAAVTSCEPLLILAPMVPGVCRAAFIAVPAAGIAAGLLVPARLPGGDTVVVVIPLELRGDADLSGSRHRSRQLGDRRARSSLQCPTALHSTATARQSRSLTVQRLRVAQAAVQVGVAEEALAMTAAYTSSRHQFGRPLSTNQGVAIRAADAYLDTEAVRLTCQRAAWLLDGHDDAPTAPAVLVASMWAARAGLRVVHATQHLHGGMGADLDYPIHRYFQWGRQAAFTLGTAASLAAELGAVLTDATRIGAPA